MTTILTVLGITVVWLVGVLCGARLENNEHTFQMQRMSRQIGDLTRSNVELSDQLRKERAANKNMSTNKEQPFNHTHTQEDTEMKKTNFPDVPENAWYEDFVKIASDAGIMVGYDDGNFYPENALKRCEAAKIVALLLEKIQNE